MRQLASDKLKVVLALKETPIVIVACKKCGLPPSTFYRWKNEDKRFMIEVRRAIDRGRESVSDIAEAHLIHSVKKGDTRTVMYWLKTFRKPYKQEHKIMIEKEEKKVVPPPKVKTFRGRTILQPSSPVGGPEIDFITDPDITPNLEEVFRESALSMLEKLRKRKEWQKAQKKSQGDAQTPQ